MVIFFNEAPFFLCDSVGTPIQNNIEELFSLIRFLHIKPYCDWDEFRDKISTPMKKTRGYGVAMQRVQALLKAICLRRTKTSLVDGKPILELPDRNVERVETPFSVDERAFYEALETRTRDRFNAYVRAGTVMKNYSNVRHCFLFLKKKDSKCNIALTSCLSGHTDPSPSPPFAPGLLPPSSDQGFRQGFRSARPRGPEGSH